MGVHSHSDQNVCIAWSTPIKYEYTLHSAHDIHREAHLLMRQSSINNWPLNFIMVFFVLRLTFYRFSLWWKLISIVIVIEWCVCVCGSVSLEDASKSKSESRAHQPYRYLKSMENVLKMFPLIDCHNNWICCWFISLKCALAQWLCESKKNLLFMRLIKQWNRSRFQ